MSPTKAKEAITEMESDIDSAVDLTTIKVKMRYPSNVFELTTWDFCPYTLKVQLAFEHKLTTYNDIEFSVKYISPIDTNVIETYRINTGSSSTPFLKLQYKDGVNETWLSDSTDIIKFLDSSYPQKSLFYPNDSVLSLEINIWEDWIDQAFGNAYFSLLYLNDKNFKNVSSVWLKGQKNFFNDFKMKLYRKNKVIQYASNYPSIQHALNNAYKRFDETLLPAICDKLELSHSKGDSFIFGNEITAADLGLYAFLRSILLLEEASLVSRRSILLKFMDEIESIPLNKVQGNIKKGYTRQKLTLIGKTPNAPAGEE